MRLNAFYATSCRFLAGILAIFTAGSSHAQTATTQFNVTLTVLDECLIQATDMAFGTTTIIAAGAEAQSAITVECTAGTPYAIGLSAGTGAGATVAARQMTGPEGTVEYSLYQNAARTTLWGNTPGVNTVGSAAATGGEQVYPVYGLVPPGQSDAAPGAYSDTVTATITYGPSL